MKATWLKSAMGAASAAGRWLAVVAGVAVLSASCGRRESRVPAGMRIEGLALSQPGPVLSWRAVAGAAEYGVSVVGEAGTRAFWVWRGAATQVPYGVADVGGLGEDSSFMPTMRPWHVRSLQPGGHYRWLVVALDARGRTVAVSDIRHFSAPGVARPAASPAPEASRPTAAPAPAAPGWTGKLLSTLAGRAHPVEARHACDALSREQLRPLLGQDPGEPERKGARCIYGKLLTLETGPGARYATQEKLFRGVLDELPVKGVGTKAFYCDFYVGVQLHVRDQRFYAYVNLEDKTDQRLEHAKAIAAALLAGAGADAPR